MDVWAIGKRIKEIRERNGITQEQLAELAELSPTHVSVIERGVKLPRLETFIRICNVLGVSADTLLVDVVDNSTEVVTSELSLAITELSVREREKVLKVVRILTEK